VHSVLSTENTKILSESHLCCTVVRQLLRPLLSLELLSALWMNVAIYIFHHVPEILVKEVPLLNAFIPALLYRSTTHAVASRALCCSLQWYADAWQHSESHLYRVLNVIAIGHVCVCVFIGFSMSCHVVVLRVQARKNNKAARLKRHQQLLEDERQADSKRQQKERKKDQV
jgi:hypothetical protein